MAVLLAVACAAVFAAAATSRAQVGLVQNQDFEVDADNSGNPDLWFPGGPVSYVNDDSDGVGIRSIGANDGGDWRSRAFPVTPGLELTYSLDYKVSAGATGTIRTDLRFVTAIDAGGGTSGLFQGEFAPTTDVAAVPQDVWNTLGPFTVTVPQGQNPPAVVPAFGDVRLSAGIFGPDLVGTVQFDNVRVIPEPASLALLGLCGLGLLARRRI
jgi:hypothetical protein